MNNLNLNLSLNLNLNPPLRILSAGLNLTLGRGICSDRRHTPRAQCVIAYNNSFAEKDRFSIFAANRRQKRRQNSGEYAAKRRQSSPSAYSSLAATAGPLNHNKQRPLRCRACPGCAKWIGAKTFSFSFMLILDEGGLREGWVKFAYSSLAATAGPQSHNKQRHQARHAEQSVPGHPCRVIGCVTAMKMRLRTLLHSRRSQADAVGSYAKSMKRVTCDTSAS
jgi:hypothetical protein